MMNTTVFKDLGAVLVAALCAAAQAAPLALDTAALTNVWEEAGISAYKCRIAFRDFGKNVADANAEAAAKRTKLDTTARVYLKSQMEKAQAEGDLDRVLVFKSALESARGGAITGDDEAVVKLRESYDRQLALADKALLDAGLAAARAFAASLDEQKKEATKKGDIADAQKIAAFQRKVGEWAKAVQGLATQITAAQPTETPRPKPQPRPPVREVRPPVPKAGERKVIRIGSQEVALRWCPPGSFTMGSPVSENGRNDNETSHRVTLTTGFWMGETEVTQGLWKEVMGTNPSRFKFGDNYPVEGLSWNDCQDFVTAINARAEVQDAGGRFALPTEAQWEYACRAGTTSAYYWGNEWNDDKATGYGNTNRKTTPVGSYQANPWGFYDMHGNVWTWCSDWYETYPEDSATNPTGATSGSERVLRGGSWVNPTHVLRSAFRGKNHPTYKDPCLGLRVVLLLPDSDYRDYRDNTGSVRYSGRIIPAGGRESPRAASAMVGDSDSRKASYCVIDLSAGANASSYPVTYLTEPPSHGFNMDEYKTTKLVLKRIEAGSYKMGESVNVTLSKPFFIGIFEVTQKQYQLVTGSNPSRFSGDKRPVEMVSYNAIRGLSEGAQWPASSAVDSSSFLGKLRAGTGLDFDLPTEAQWEYACRAGTTTTYSYGNSVNGDYMWYPSNSSSQTHDVGTKKPNPWDLYDMHGNAWEWCLDWCGTLTYGTDPKGSSSESRRVLRSGCWRSNASWCTSSHRGSSPSSSENNGYGFRLAMTINQ